MAADSTYCSACGQVIHAAPAYGARKSGANRIGIAISVALHLLVVAVYLLHDEPVRRAPPPAPQEAMVYIAPTAPAARPAPKPTPKPKPTELAKAKPARQKPTQVAAAPPTRAPDTVVPPLVSKLPVPPAPEPPMDMSERIAARQRQRAESQPAPQPAEQQESENDRALRVARANIAGAQGRNGGDDRNDSGGVFSVVNQTFQSADVKFRGWNGNFKRTWSQQIHVERGAEQDIETAIVKRMIELIRKEKPGDFVWDSQRLGRHVNLSARVEDEAELRAFLLQEFFPAYRPGAR